MNTLYLRTQTPTNSDSPVPSLHNDDIRKRVLEELNQQESTANNNLNNNNSNSNSNNSQVKQR